MVTSTMSVFDVALAYQSELDQGLWNSVGMDIHQMLALHEFQSQSNWCWAACVSMLCKYYGVPIEQWGVVASAFRGIYDRPADIFTIARQIDGHQIPHTPFLLECRPAEGCPPTEILLRHFEMGFFPVFCFNAGFHNIGHAIILAHAGYHYRGGQRWIGPLFALDPSPSGERVLHVKRNTHLINATSHCFVRIKRMQ